MDADRVQLRVPQKAPEVITAPLPLPPTSSILVPPLAGPSSKITSKPASTAPVDIDPQCEKHADLLVELGIKVRDFAYESKLPPVPPYRVRQIQPGPAPLKRARKDGEQDDLFQTGSSTGAPGASSSKKSKLEREDTEPDMSQQPANSSRPRGFININTYIPPTPRSSQSPELSPPGGSPQPFESQDSEPYVVTPIVTPNGSCQWPDVASDIPLSQLDIESQANDPVFLTYSQLGMSDLESQPLEPESQPLVPESVPELPDTTGTGLVGMLTPMSSLSSIGSDAPASPLPFVSRAFNFTTSSHDPPLSRPSASHLKPSTPPIPTSRYQLRRRPIPPSPQSPSVGGTRRRIYNTAHPLSHTVSYSKVSHSKTKTPRFSRARIIRSHGGPNSNRDETMIVR